MDKAKESKVETKTIHTIGLHEQLIIDGAMITRVPGGWLYSLVEKFDNQELAMPPVFVPYSDELKTTH